MKRQKPLRARLATLLIVSTFALAASTVACKGGGTKGGNDAGAASVNSPSEVGRTDVENVTALDAEIERLESEAEKNPSDEETRAELSRVLVRRANLLRRQNRLREAMIDYQSALRFDTENEEAQRGAAQLSQQTEGSATGEFGEPEPLPITPNVVSGDPQPSPTPSPSPAKGSEVRKP